MQCESIGLSAGVFICRIAAVAKMYGPQV